MFFYLGTVFDIACYLLLILFGSVAQSSVTFPEKQHVNGCTNCDFTEQPQLPPNWRVRCIALQSANFDVIEVAS